MIRFLLILFLLTPCFAYSQVEQMGRWEAGIDADDPGNYKVSSVDSLGLLIYHKLNNLRGDQLELIMLDTTLQEKWRGFITLEKGLIVTKTTAYKNFYYILLQRPGFAGFVMISLNLNTGLYTTHLIKNAIPFTPSEFQGTIGAVLIGGYFNYRPLVLHYSFQTNKAKVLPGFFNEPGELTQMKITPDGSIDVIVSSKNYEKRKSLWIRNYNAEGDLIKSTVLESRDKKNLIFGRSIKMPNNEQVVAGVYGKNSEYSRGIFVAAINPVGEYTIRYYNFADLQNFFRYLKAKQEKRIKKRIERRRVKGKSTRFSYRLLVQELIPYQDQFVLLGEAFYPNYVYRQSGFNNNGFGRGGFANYAPYRNDAIFDGYQYTHAIVIGFDSNGKVKWDNSFEINDVKSFQLEQFVKIAPGKDNIGLLYLFENLIRTKVIRNNEVLEGKTADELKIFSDEGIVTREDAKTSHLDYWYGNTLFASGVQTVRKSKDGSLPFKKVFFINKIRYK
ncbi:MAG: hypothetical protein ACK5RG_17135 [Cyclobacteriaceae bacterium]|nr:hypothetical protein [Flammeovirgaceae bacterium]